MTTQQYSTPIDQSSTANFRAWGLALSTAIQATGLVQTADTGQIDWATVNLPGSGNTAAGYEIYRFDDPLQATVPVFIKLEYGTNSTGTNRAAIWVTVGAGSNGSGTITGQATSRLLALINAVPGSSVTSYPTHVCYVDGFFGFSFKGGAASVGRGLGGVFIERTVDDTGAYNSDGIFVMVSSNSSMTVETIGIATGVTYSMGDAICVVYGTVASSAVGSDNQVYKHYGIFPRVRPVIGTNTVLISEVGSTTTFSVALVGATPRNYISVSSYLIGADVTGYTACGLAMLWE